MMERQAPFVNNANERPLRILSLDGGGVRGYSMLLLLQEVMHKLFYEMEGRAPARWEVPRPCDHFDLIGGTGTGGLIALMLGRLRIDIATALELYVEMTRRVFETNKTLGGIPYGKTLYKASKLAEVIKETTSRHLSGDTLDHRTKPTSTPSLAFSWTSNATRAKRSQTMPSSPAASPVHNPETVWKPQVIDRVMGETALWYDERPGRCKTFVTAIYKGSSAGTTPALIRTYDSAVESSPSGNCRIWEAGRATCAVFPAFKPIQVGQNIFLDEGHGKFNPSLLVLEEAIANEWPGRQVGVFVSIGSGKLPPHMESPPIGAIRPTSVRDSIIGVTPLQKFVEARENHITKIEECEQFHHETVRRLRAKGIDEEVYFRLNVDTGVGQAGMSEWDRLADISTRTRTYLSKPNVQRMNAVAAMKLAKIWKEKQTDMNINNKALPKPPPETRKFISQPIVPNLASEFGRLNPPYKLSNPTSSSTYLPTQTTALSTSFSGNNYPVPRLPINTTRPAPPPMNTLTPPTISSPFTFTRIPVPPRSHTHPADTRQNLYKSSSASLPLYEPTSAPDFSPMDLGYRVPERLPSLEFDVLRGTEYGTPSTSASGSVGLGIEVKNEGRNAGNGGHEEGMGVGMMDMGRDMEMDEEVALHFRELQRIAGKIERESQWAQERGYFNA